MDPKPSSSKPMYAIDPVLHPETAKRITQKALRSKPIHPKSQTYIAPQQIQHRSGCKPIAPTVYGLSVVGKNKEPSIDPIACVLLRALAAIRDAKLLKANQARGTGVHPLYTQPCRRSTFLGIVDIAGLWAQNLTTFWGFWGRDLFSRFCGVAQILSAGLNKCGCGDANIQIQLLTVTGLVLIGISIESRTQTRHTSPRKRSVATHHQRPGAASAGANNVGSRSEFQYFSVENHRSSKVIV